jgi:tripartite-type tricarboxylate transporter receptor subunit TctC
MKNLLILLISLMLTLGAALAQENIVVLNPQGAGYSGTPQFLATIRQANKIQTKYRFIPEFKVGGFESIALLDVKNNPQTHITSVVTTHLEAADRGLIKLNDYVPVFANGDACWALASNVGNEKEGLASLQSVNEIIVGAPALGGALHLMALEIGKKYNKPVRFIFYKTNGEAVQAMITGDVNLTLDRVNMYQSYKTMFPNVQLMAMTCSKRHSDALNLKTLTEQGFDVPPIFNVIVASKDMNDSRRSSIQKIFEDASRAIGEKDLVKFGDHLPPMFQFKNSSDYYYTMVEKHQLMRSKWKKEVEAAR